MMGYTHYAYLNRAGPQAAWAEAVMAARAIIKAAPVPLADGDGQPGTEPKYGDEGIYTNGVGVDGHETLFVPTVLSKVAAQPSLVPVEDRYFMFCKTARKPYDVVVTAVYATLAAIAGPDCIVVESDGRRGDWAAGCKLASDVLGREIPVPL